MDYGLWDVSFRICRIVIVLDGRNCAGRNAMVPMSIFHYRAQMERKFSWLTTLR